MTHSSSPLPNDRRSQPVEEVIAVLAVVAGRKAAGCDLLAPDDPACFLRVYSEELITLSEMPVNRRFARIQRLVITVVNDGSCHTAEDGLDDIEKLSTRRQGSELGVGCLVLGPVGRRVDQFDPFVEQLRRVPGGSVPGQIDLVGIGILLDEDL